jgi:hypothetical protein
MASENRKENRMVWFVGWTEWMERIGNHFFEFSETEMEELEMNLNCEFKCLNFLKDRNLEIDQGFRSNEFALKVCNISK